MWKPFSSISCLVLQREPFCCVHDKSLREKLFCYSQCQLLDWPLSSIHFLPSWHAGRYCQDFPLQCGSKDKDLCLERTTMVGAALHGPYDHLPRSDLARVRWEVSCCISVDSSSCFVVLFCFLLMFVWFCLHWFCWCFVSIDLEKSEWARNGICKGLSVINGQFIFRNFAMFLSSELILERSGSCAFLDKRIRL